MPGTQQDATLDLGTLSLFLQKQKAQKNRQATQANEL
jgi:hypothetical protein